MYNNDQGNYDVIGDIHGHVTQLENLLKKLAYTQSGQGFYFHPTRKVIFLGDFVDGGSEHKKVIDIVKPMVENQAAYAIMGNHEFNAISFHTNHPNEQRQLRERSIKNIGQHIEFLSEYKKDNKKMLAAIEWFKTLPLFLDLPEVRAIHACWSEHEINKIKHYLTSDNTVKREFFEEFYLKANTKDSVEFDAVEILLKGVEIPLPQGIVFADKSGTPRNNIRIKWWLEGATTYKEYALVQKEVIDNLPDLAIQQNLIAPYYYPTNQKPVFIGHYWREGTPELQASNVACLDYSVGKSMNQVAYQWDKGDKQLTNNNFVCSLNDSDHV
jgi:hypothetical protein